MRLRLASALVAGLCAFAGAASFAPPALAEEEGTSDPDATSSGSEAGGDSAGTVDHGGESPAPEDEEKAAATAKADVTIQVVPSPTPFRRFWVGVAASLDLAVVGSFDDVCKLGSLALPLAYSGAYCTTPYGDDFPSRSDPMQNNALIPGRSGTLDGGVKLGDIRVMLAADYAVTSSVLVGLRLGYVFNSYPGEAAVSGRPAFLRNIHAEVRGTYVFGKDALLKVGFAPAAFFGAGVTTTDAHDQTFVSLAGVRGQTPVNAWQIGGPFFATLGGGARYAFSSRAAFNASWKVGLAFGSPGPLFTTGPELSFQYGF